MINKKFLILILIFLGLTIMGSVTQGAIGAPCSTSADCDTGVGEYCKCRRCAAGCSGSLCINNPLCADSFQALIDSLINAIFWLAIVIVPLMIIIGAIYYVTSGGSPEKIKTAKNMNGANR